MQSSGATTERDGDYDRLIVIDFLGKHAVGTVAELRALLQTRHPPHDANCFYISPVDDAESPLFVAHVVGEKATVWYTPSPGDAGYVSWTDGPNREESLTFFSDARGEQHDAAMNSVMSASQFEEAMLTYLRTQELPSAIPWRKL